MPNARIIAEIGGNHQGSLDTAKRMIETAKLFCDVDGVKFQKRTPKELLSDREFQSPHPEPHHAFGRSYGEHREYLEFSIEAHRELKGECDLLGVMYSSSVWDLTSAREIVSLEPAYIKIPSAKNTHFPLLDFLCRDYPGEIHVSLGMTTRREESDLVDFFIKRGRNRDLVLYACTSGYPVPHRDVCLLEISRLKSEYDSTIRAVGFSGHHKGIAIDVAAFTLGAEIIERHFTLDRTWKGTDHAASLEPDGMRRVVRDIRAVSQALCLKPNEILDIEIPQRSKLKGT